MRIAMMPGHSRRKEGATVCAGYYEDFGEHALASHYLPKLRDELEAHGFTDIVLTQRESQGGHTPYYSALAANDVGADIALEWHFNCADDPTANGCEVLYWYRSEKGKLFAERLSAKLAKVLGVKDRGAKPIGASRNDRGYSAFAESVMPFFMVEPCFAGSNAEEARIWGLKIRDKIWHTAAAKAVAEAIEEVYKKKGA